MTDTYPISAVIAELVELVKRQGSQKQAAKFLGISEQYLADVLRGRRAPGKKVLEALGLQKVVVYKWVGKKGWKP